MADPQPLVLSAVTKRFGGVVAVQDVSLALTAGTVCGLVGPNGAGKTTLINVVTGFDAPSAGEVLFDGAPVTGWQPHRLARRGLARTFQHAHGFGSMTALDTLVAAAHTQESGHRMAAVRGLWPSGARKRVTARARELLDRLRLTPWSAARSDQLPYGIRKRLGLAAALMIEPRVLLLDEPAAGLSSAETSELMEDIRDTNARGTTVLIVEHNMPLIMSVCHCIVVLDQGAKVAEGTPAEIASNPDVIRAYLGRR